MFGRFASLTVYQGEQIHSLLVAGCLASNQCTVKIRTIQDNLHLVYTVIEEIDTEATLTNLNQSKSFDRDDYSFLKTSFSC